MTDRLNIFDLLGEVDGKNVEGYDQIAEPHKKQFAPSVILRWLSGTKSASQIVLLNDTANKYVFSCWQHPNLIYKTFVAAVDGGRHKRYQWIKPLPRTGRSAPTATAAIMEYFKYDRKTAELSIKLMSIDDVVQCAQELGYEQQSITKIKQELKTKT